MKPPAQPDPDWFGTNRFVLFMKVGFHSAETLEKIISRKQMEDKSVGYFFWGYGGTVCHPMTQVATFLDLATTEGQIPIFAMIRTASKFIGSNTSAQEFSKDGQTWQNLPSGICVFGSKYALVCSNLRAVELHVNLWQYHVAVGPGNGRKVSDYLRYQVDKVCAVRKDESVGGGMESEIIYLADIIHPGAVFLR